MIDYYKVLGVERNATTDEIKKAYREKAKENHPDVGGDQEVFKSIALAYEILSDDRKRSWYDLGEDVSSNGQSVVNIAIQNIQNYFLDFLQQDYQMQDLLGQTSQGYLDRISQKIRGEKSHMRQHSKTLKKSLKFFIAKQDKIKRKDKQPDVIFDGALTYTIRRLRSERFHLALGLAATRKSLQLLKTNETQKKIDHFNAQVSECDFIITGISFDGSCEDMERARSQGYEIDYAMGRVFYIAPKEKKS